MIKGVGLFIILVLCWYTIIVSGVQAFKKPSLTKTELFLLLPKNFILEFEK